MFGPVRGVVRGTVAWISGYLLTWGLLAVGIVDSTMGVARTFLEAHTVVLGAGTDPITMVAVPALAVGGMGYRIGSDIGAGALGRLRSTLGALFGSRSNHTRTAVTAGVYLAIGYAVVAAVAAASVGTAVDETAVSSLVVALVVGVPTALAGVRS